MKAMIRLNIIFVFLLTDTVLSSNRLIGNERRFSSDDNALMELAEQVLIRSGQDVTDFRNALTRGNAVLQGGDGASNRLRDSGDENVSNSLEMMSFEDIIAKAEKDLKEITDELSGKGMKQHFEESEDGEETASDEAGDVTSSSVVEKIVVKSVYNGTAGNKTIEITKTFPNGTTTHTIKSIPLHPLKKNATSDDIADAYNNVMKIMPKVLNITVEWDKKISDAIDDFTKKMKKASHGSKKFSDMFDAFQRDYIWDYDWFSSFMELDDVDRIGVDDNVWNDLNTLAEDVLKVIRFH